MNNYSYAVSLESIGLEKNNFKSDFGTGKSFKTTLLGIDISTFSEQTQFVLISFGVFVSFILYGYLLEFIFIQPALKSHGLYLTFLQFLLYAVFAFLELYFKKDMKRRIPLSAYIVISLMTVSTMTMSNLSLEYLNYPTQVIFKSCKLIPVLVGGILIQRKKYGMKDFIAAVTMCLGLIWFTLIDVTISPNFHPTGVIMISLALVADAIIGNVQEKAIKMHGASNSEVVFYSYSMGLVYLIAALVLTGHLIPAVIVANQHKLQMYGVGFLLSLTGYLGVNLVLTLVRIAGALAAVTVTTCRKTLSIVLSFIFFTKPFTLQYIWAGLLVVIGLYMNVSNKQQIRVPPYFMNHCESIFRFFYRHFEIYRRSPKSTFTV